MILLQAGSVLATDRVVRAEAERIFRGGVRFLRQEQTMKALTFFERSLAYRVSPNSLWNGSICHIMHGDRDMTLWLMERYLAIKPQIRASLEVQQAMAAIEEQGENIPWEVAEPLFVELSEAVEAAADGNATPAEPSQQIYGTGRSSPAATARSHLAHELGTRLFRHGLEELPETSWDTNLTFFERSLAYRMARNAAYNIAAIHLDQGRRDLSVHFYRIYILSTPEIQQDVVVRRALEAIEDSPPHVGNQARRDELADRMELAVQRVLGSSQTRDATPRE